MVYTMSYKQLNYTFYDYSAKSSYPRAEANTWPA